MGFQGNHWSACGWGGTGPCPRSAALQDRLGCPNSSVLTKFRNERRDTSVVDVRVCCPTIQPSHSLELSSLPLVPFASRTGTCFCTYQACLPSSLSGHLRPLLLSPWYFCRSRHIVAGTFLSFIAPDNNSEPRLSRASSIQPRCVVTRYGIRVQPSITQTN